MILGMNFRIVFQNIVFKYWELFGLTGIYIRGNAIRQVKISFPFFVPIVSIRFGTAMNGLKMQIPHPLRLIFQNLFSLRLLSFFVSLQSLISSKATIKIVNIPMTGITAKIVIFAIPGKVTKIAVTVMDATK